MNETPTSPPAKTTNRLARQLLQQTARASPPPSASPQVKSPLPWPSAAGWLCPAKLAARRTHWALACTDAATDAQTGDGTAV